MWLGVNFLIQHIFWMGRKMHCINIVMQLNSSLERRYRVLYVIC